MTYCRVISSFFWATEVRNREWIHFCKSKAKTQEFVMFSRSCELWKVSWLSTIIEKECFLSRFRGSTFALVCFSWLLDHMIYLKLRWKLLLLQAEKLTKWRLWPFWVKIVFEFCEFAELCKELCISFPAWDKSRDPLANWRKL